MAGKLRFNAELFFTFCLMVLGVVVLIVSIGYGFGSFRSPGAGLYPFFVAMIIIIFSLILLIQRLRAGSGEPLFAKSGLKTFSLMTITFCLWIMMMPFLGYVIMTFVVAYAFCKIMKLEGWLKPFGLSIATAVFIYLLFEVWLYIDLPRGIFGL